MIRINKVLVLCLIFFLFLTYSIVNISYSNYRNDIDVNINSKSADLICDVEIDNPGTYISNDGWAYFKVIIKNYDESGNVTKVPMQYNLTVSNNNGSNAIYRYLDASGNSNDFINTFTTRNYKFSSEEKESQVINVEVRTDSMASENVNFAIDLNCYQIEK